MPDCTSCGQHVSQERWDIPIRLCFDCTTLVKKALDDDWNQRQQSVVKTTTVETRQIEKLIKNNNRPATYGKWHRNGRHFVFRRALQLGQGMEETPEKRTVTTYFKGKKYTFG